jgi:hypothetical protein
VNQLPPPLERHRLPRHLETAKACVIQQAIKELRDDDEE